MAVEVVAGVAKAAAVADAKRGRSYSMSSFNKYAMMGVSTLLLPLVKLVIQKMIGKLNKHTETLENDAEDEMARISPQRPFFPAGR